MSVLDSAPAVAGRGDVQPVKHETMDRTICGLATVLPMLAVGLAAWYSWEGLLQPGDLIVFAVMYVATGLGITVGYHRHFTHRSFKGGGAVRAVLAILGSAAIEGPVISWVADHRKHHAFADQQGDPHSPHVDHGVGWAGCAARAAACPHRRAVPARPARRTRALCARSAGRSGDPLRQPDVRAVGASEALPRHSGWGESRSEARSRPGSRGCFRAAPCGCSCCITSRTASTRSATSSGGRSFDTPGTSHATCSGSRWPSFGEAWHNNHHAFPTSARHGLEPVRDRSVGARHPRTRSVAGWPGTWSASAPSASSSKAVSAKPGGGG